MNRHTILIALFALAHLARSEAVEPPARPNILILLADDLGWNGVGFHRKGATTPALDQLAREGTELRRMYTYPVCTPARAALLTGMMPRRFGFADVIAPRQPGLPAGTMTLPAVLREAGYTTALIGKWHVGTDRPPTAFGFNHFYGFPGPELDYYRHTNQRGIPDLQRDGTNVSETGYSTDLFAAEAIRQIRQRDAKKPFFIQVAFNAPHVPLAAPEELIAKHHDAGRGAVYAAVIEAMDLAIGRILRALDDENLRENTLVLFYSDNGASRQFSDNAPLRHGKGTVYEGGIRTPCVIRWPGRIAAHAISEQPVSGQDWFPTLAAAAGVPLTGTNPLDGRNQWLPLREGKKMSRDAFLIASYDHALVDGEWKLIEFEDGKRSLFNVVRDPSETKDEYASQPVIARRLSARLAELKKELPPAGERRPRPVPGGGGAGSRSGPPGGGPR